MQQAFAQPLATQSIGGLAERAAQETPEHRAMSALHDRMGTLPPRLQMFLPGCPAGLEARRERISCRQGAARTVLALAAGVRRTAYWSLAPEYPGPVDDRQMMYLMIGKLPLLGYQDGKLSRPTPAADSFALTAAQLGGARAVTRTEIPGQPSACAFEVDRGERSPLLVVWDQRAVFDGEDEPPVTVSWPWPAEKATVTDVFGATGAVPVRDGLLSLTVTDTPLFVS